MKAEWFAGFVGCVAGFVFAICILIPIHSTEIEKARKSTIKRDQMIISIREDLIRTGECESVRQAYLEAEAIADEIMGEQKHEH